MACKVTDYLYLYQHVFQSCGGGHNVKLSGEGYETAGMWHVVLWRQHTDLDPQKRRCENLKCRKLNDTDGPLARTGILFGTDRKTALLSGVYVNMATLLWAQVHYGITAAYFGPLTNFNGRKGHV